MTAAAVLTSGSIGLAGSSPPEKTISPAVSLAKQSSANGKGEAGRGEGAKDGVRLIELALDSSSVGIRAGMSRCFTETSTSVVAPLTRGGCSASRASFAPVRRTSSRIDSTNSPNLPDTAFPPSRVASNVSTVVA